MNTVLQKWITKAENDLKTAQHELKLEDNDVVTDAVCFHSQQAVEKLLKAYLIAQEEEFGRTHNLELLLQLCGKHDKSFLEQKLGNLSEYAVSIRYPDDFYIPDLDEATAAYQLAKNIGIFILNKLTST